MKQCAICKKSYNRARNLVKLRGKYNPTTIKIQKCNLQKVKLPLTKKRVLLCTKCMKTNLRDKI